MRRLPWRDGLAEALRALAANSSEHLAPILGVRELGDVVEVERAWVAGTPLSERLAIEGPRPPMEVVRLGVDLCRALQALHRIDVPRLDGPLLHGTLDPGAIVRTADGTTVLTDAGHWASVNRLGAASESGPHPTLAPPTPTGPVPSSPGDDVYAVGVLLHTALTGSRPEDGAVVSPVVARCPADLLEIVAESLHPDPELRPRTCGALRARLSGILCRALAAPAPGGRTPTADDSSDGLVFGRVTEQHGAVEVFPGEDTPWDSLHPVADLPTEREGRRRLHQGIRWAGWGMAVVGLGLAILPLLADPPPATGDDGTADGTAEARVERPQPVAAARPRAVAPPAQPLRAEAAATAPAPARGGRLGAGWSSGAEAPTDGVAGRDMTAPLHPSEAQPSEAQPSEAQPRETRSAAVEERAPARPTAERKARRAPTRTVRSRAAAPDATEPENGPGENDSALQIRYRDAEDAPDVPAEPPRRRATGWPAPPLPDLLPVE